jgi:archaemetzincin
MRDPFELDPIFFRKKSEPQPGDWLAEQHERGQTFLQFEQASTLRPTVARRTIVLQPLGEFTEAQCATLVTLQRATTLFFGLPVEVEQGAPLPKRGRRVRQRSAGASAQYLTSEILNFLSRRTPEHAITYLGVTFQDLYPEPSWNFVFGEAELSARVDDARWISARSASLSSP